MLLLALHILMVTCRWFVMGPARSGSGLHVDPLATSAWNALVAGHKRWALFPPGTPRHLVLPKLPGLEREAVSWFTHVYPLTQRPDWPTAKPIDVIQVSFFSPVQYYHVDIAVPSAVQSSCYSPKVAVAGGAVLRVRAGVLSA